VGTSGVGDLIYQIKAENYRATEYTDKQVRKGVCRDGRGTIAVLTVAHLGPFEGVVELATWRPTDPLRIAGPAGQPERGCDGAAQSTHHALHVAPPVGSPAESQAIRIWKFLAGLEYILGVRERGTKEVRERRAGRADAERAAGDPALGWADTELQDKEVMVC